MKDKLILTAVAAGLGILGTLLGGWFAAHQENIARERSAEREERTQIISQRILTLERAVALFSKRDTAVLLDLQAKTALKLNEVDVASGDVEASFENRLERVLSSREKLSELEAEYSAVLTLCLVYFGPATEAAVRELQRTLAAEGKYWWQAEDPAVQELINSAAGELRYWQRGGISVSEVEDPTR